MLVAWPNGRYILIKLKLYCGSYIVLMPDTLTKLKLLCPVVSYVVLMTMYIVIEIRLHCPSGNG